MDDLLAQQIEHELQDATRQFDSGTANKLPRVSTGKLRTPSARQQRSLKPLVKPRKIGANKNLRRLEGGPTRDTFEQLSSPEKGKRGPRLRAVLYGTISPRRDGPRIVAHHPTPVEGLAVAGDAPALKAPNAQESPHRSPQKRTNDPREDDVSPEGEADHVVSDPMSQALANAVDSGSNAGNESDGHESESARGPPQGDDEGMRRDKAAATFKPKTRNSRSSKPVASSARKPASGGAERSSPQVVIPAPKKIRPGSLYPCGDDVTEALPEDELEGGQADEPEDEPDDEPEERPRDRPIVSKAPTNKCDHPTNDDQQLKAPETEALHQISKHARKRKADAPQAATRPRKTTKRFHRVTSLGQNHELFGQQSLLRQAYQTIDNIGWSYKEGEKYSRADVDLDDDQVISIKKLCREAKSKFSLLKATSDDQDMTSDPPEELTRICNEVRTLETREQYFGDRNKVHNIYFHLFASLVKLVRDAIDCYGEMDKDHEELTPQRSITIHHLGVVTSLLRAITSIHDVLGRKYCAPQKNLCVKQPVSQIIVALRLVQIRFTREIRRHRDKEQEKLEAIARAEEERLLDERYEREEAIAKQHAELRKQWFHLHDERRHVDVNILPVWKIQHLAVPKPEPDRDGNGEPFERLEVFAPRIGPSLASTDKARAVEWNAIELDALRTGLEECAGPRLFVKIFRRYCTRGGPLNRFNVTEIVTLAADMLQWVENKQRRSGHVEDWVREAKQYMWTKPKVLGSGQENHVDAAD